MMRSVLHLNIPRRVLQTNQVDESSNLNLVFLLPCSENRSLIFKLTYHGLLSTFI